MARGSDRRTNTPHVDCVKLTPDQKFLCAVDNGLDQVKIYRVDYTYGKLKLVDIIQMCIRDRECIVLGYPKNMNNTEGERCEKTKEFKEMLERRTGLEVILWDERLTTVSADKHMMESGIRREDRKKYVDEIAAVFILQGYLDYRSMHVEK